MSSRASRASRAPVSVGDRPLLVAEVCRPPEWMKDGECQDTPFLPWTTDLALTSEYERGAMAVICADCPVLAECALAAAVNEALYRYEEALHTGGGSSSLRVALYAAVEQLYRHAKQLHEQTTRLTASRGLA